MKLSIIVPCYNELDYIEGCIDSLVDNDWDFSSTEILIVDGMSTDGTREVIEEKFSEYGFVKLIDNPKRVQVSGLNLALNSCDSEFVIRCDAHALYPKDYIKKLVGCLEEMPEVGNVGVPVKTVTSKSNMSQVALENAMSSKVGVGASHRTNNSTSPVEVDTVLFGAWKRKIFDDVGFFDEDFIRGQDYEHNYRIRGRGKKVLQIPSNPVVYFTRPTLEKAIKKIFQYAVAKVHVIKKHNVLPNVRSFAPFCLYLAFFLIGLYSVKFSLVLFSLYASSIFIYSFKMSGGLRIKALFSTYVIMLHASHAYGILYGLFSFFLLKRKRVNFEHTR